MLHPNLPPLRWRRTPLEVLASPVASEWAVACLGRLGSKAILAEGPFCLSCPQLSWRAQLEGPKPLLVLADAVSPGGQPAAKVVPVEGLARLSCLQPEAGQPTVGRIDESPRNPLIDGRCSAPSTPLPSGTGLPAAVLPQAVVPP